MCDKILWLGGGYYEEGPFEIYCKLPDDHDGKHEGETGLSTTEHTVGNWQSRYEKYVSKVTIEWESPLEIKKRGRKKNNG